MASPFCPDILKNLKKLKNWMLLEKMIKKDNIPLSEQRYIGLGEEKPIADVVAIVLSAVLFMAVTFFIMFSWGEMFNYE